jgi:hypothetical protein
MFVSLAAQQGPAEPASQGAAGVACEGQGTLEEHKHKFPQYTHQRLWPREAHGQRGGPKDIKQCEKIAQLLVEGKKSSELNATVQKFDRTHVLEIIARFETPFMAKQYCCSSSVSISDSPEPPAKKLKMTAASCCTHTCL